MANVHCYTSISLNYLPKARVLAWSLKRFHPDWTFWLCITDREPPGFRFDLSSEPFDKIIWCDELPIENIKSWLFKHDVIEVCTAVKGPVLSLLCESSGADKIFYLDPDIAVFGSLDPLVKELDTSDIVLTPHQIVHETTPEAIQDNEISSLQHGVYNLGFIGINASGEGYRFAHWWSERLKRYCFNDIPVGLFVDQRWCDMIPAFFDKVKVIRNAGYNVASWNLSSRKISINSQGEILANNDPLKFYHFTKIEGVGLGMVKKYAKDNIHVYEIVSWYRHWLNRFRSPQIPKKWWFYGHYENGEPIIREHRLLYRGWPELQSSYLNPFATGSGTFHQWLHDNEQEWKSASFSRQNKNPESSAEEEKSRRLPRIPRLQSRWAEPCRQLIRDILSRGIKEVIVYGAGDVGRAFVPEARACGLRVAFAVDRNPILWGQHLEGVPIMSLQQVMQHKLHNYAIASFSYTDEISAQIKKSYANQSIDPVILCRRN
jgi:lipopolysaccharide biosynthesis glycosyltransferase